METFTLSNSNFELRVSNFKIFTKFYMGQGDFIPTGRHRRKHDPKHAKKIIEGGKKADAIRQKAMEEHNKIDVPAAEDELLKDLENIS